MNSEGITKKDFDYKLGTFRGGLYTNFINCIQSNITLTQKSKLILPAVTGKSAELQLKVVEVSFKPTL